MAFLSRVSRSQSKEKATKNAKLQAEAVAAAAEAERANKQLFAIPSFGAVGKAGTDIVKAVATDPLKTLLVKPADRAAEVVGRTGVLGKTIKRGYEDMADAGEGRTFASIPVEQQKGFGQGGGAQIAGDAVKSASYLLPAKGVEQGVVALMRGNVRGAAAAGATSGALFGGLDALGNSAQKENVGIGELAKDTAVGTGIGGILGLVLGGGGAALASRQLEQRAAAIARDGKAAALPPRQDAEFAGMSIEERLAATGERKLPVFGDTTPRRIPVDGQSRTEAVPFANDYRQTRGDIPVGTVPRGAKGPVAGQSPATGAKAPPGMRYEPVPDAPRTPVASAVPETAPTAVPTPKSSPVAVSETSVIDRDKLREPGIISSPEKMKEVVQTRGAAEKLEDEYMEQLFDANDQIAAAGGKDVAPSRLILQKQDAETAIRTLRAIKDDLPTNTLVSSRSETPRAPVGETKASGLARGVEAQAVEKKLTDGFEGLSEYETINIKDQAERASDLMARDPEKARRVAMGLEEAPEGTKNFAVYIAVEQKAIKDGDVDTLRDLATRSRLNAESSGAAQTLRLLAERDPESPVAAIADIAKAREKAAARRGMKDPQKQVATEVKAAKAAIARAPKTPKETWSSFVDDLTC